jgi:tetratricopeptide (TPR) repeat protein
MYARIKSCIAMNKFRHLILASLLITGCAEVPKPVISAKPEQLEQPVQAAPEPVQEVALPDVELSNDLLYEMLLTEFANQRGQKALAVEGSADLAQKTRDPRLAKRAAQLALESGDMNRAVAAFKLWQEIEPTSLMATRMLSSLLLRGGYLEEARPYLVTVLKADGPNVGITFLQLYPLMAPYPDKAAALKLMRDLAAPYPEVSEAHWVVAQLAQAAGNEMLALDEARLAHKQRPSWDAPVSLEAQLLSRTAPEQSLTLLARYLSDYPQANELRLQYARELLEQKKYQAAHDEFQYLAHESPDNVELAFAVALISLQLNDLPGAEAELKAALDKNGKNQDAVEYFLGQLNEAKEDAAEALLHYRGVHAGEYQYAAQLRVAYLLSRQGKLDEARRVLQQAQVDTPARRAELVIVEAQLLREAQQSEAAFQVLQLGLVKLPDNPELLYEAGMQAELLGRYDESEQLLRRLIKIKPDHAHAYNALGYGFLERNVRTNEALTLVEKALQLAPGDHAIMDSVGWAYYRAGRLNESVAMLRRAYDGNPDPEIAAHLGEVLWVRGDKEEAARLWQDSLKEHPDNEPLRAVMKRFIP